VSQGGTPLRREARTAANDTLALVKLTDHGGHDLPGEQPKGGGRTDVSSVTTSTPSSARGQRFPQPRVRRA